MDTEQTIQVILQNQVQFVTDLQELRSLTLGLARGMAEVTRLQVEQAQIVRDLAATLRQVEEDRRQFEARYYEERRRADEENREARRRFEQLHRETDERLGILIKMMDEWIRERRNNKSQ